MRRKDFPDAYRDEWRDALIVGSKQVDSIYRFRGKDLFWNINDKDLFHFRYQHNYSQLITEDLQERLENDPFLNQNPWIDLPSAMMTTE